MLQNLVITFGIVFPFMVYLGLGAFLKKINVMDDDFSAQLNRFITRVTLPVNIFNSVYQKDISAMTKSLATPYALLGQLLSIFFLMWFAKKLDKDPAKQGAMVHSGFRGNAMLFALPIAQGIFGDDVAEVTIILAVIVLANNIVAVPIMEHYRNLVHQQNGTGTAGTSKFSITKTLKSWFSTPLLDGVLLGVIWSLLRIPSPAPVTKVVSAISGTVVPLAFMVLGARLDLNHLKNNSKSVMSIVFIKLMVLPAVFLIYPICAGWNERLIVAILVAFGCPSAVASYAISEAYDCDGELAGEIVSLTSFFAMFSLFFWIFIFKQTGLVS